MAHFSHTNITKPTITHADKIFAVMGSKNGVAEMEQLQCLTERAITTNEEVADKMLRLPTEHTHGEVSQAAAAAAKEP